MKPRLLLAALAMISGAPALAHDVKSPAASSTQGPLMTADELYKAFGWDMDVLIEVHDREELDRATRLKSPLIGINNRNLHNFNVTLDTTRDLARRVPEDRLIISESGLFTPDDLADMAQYGARCFLIGESLMRQDDVEAATRAILAKPLTAKGGL